MRAVERRRRPFMTARKWSLLTVFVISLIIILVSLFYQSIQQEHWDEKDYVKSSLREYFNTSTIEYLEKYVWDEVYWIIKGKTSNDEEKLVAWKELNIIASVNTAEILSEQQLLEQLKSGSSDTTLDHIQPAFFRDQFVYEVQTKAESGHSVYTFYSMLDGKLIEQYTLPR